MDGAAPTEASWLRRGVRAIRDRRVPYRLQTVLDGLLRRLGRRYRTIELDGFRVTIRRDSWDERSARRTILVKDYTRDGFDIPKDGIVIDIGANIGGFTLTAARSAPNGVVYAFEPDRENAELVARNASSNGLVNVVVRQAAVGARSERVRLFKGEENSLHTTVPGRGSEADGFQEVDCVTLVQIFEEHGIDRCSLMKLDCEGAEYDILYATPTEYLSRIDRIAMKYHAKSAKKEKGDEMVRFLESHGFTVLEYTDHEHSDDGLIRAARSTVSDSR